MNEPDIKTNGEPVVTSAVVVALVAALIGLLVAFGVNVTDEQKVAILGVVTIAAPLVLAWVVRRKVTPTQNVAAAINQQGNTVAGPASDVTTNQPVAVVAQP